MRNTERPKRNHKQPKAVAVKLSSSLLERVRAHREEMQARAEAGARVSLAGALANLVEKGLAA